MSEIFLKNVNALIVSEVASDSPAALAGIRAGDLLRQINGKPIIDILDYRFHAADTLLEMTIERQGETLQLSLSKSLDQDAGLSFAYELGDRVHTCNNKCVFCFIHQQPRKMRKSLYLMDDDFRLSFMHGNYVTLTNIADEEWRRILDQKLSPLYVSVHATDPERRGLLLGRKAPAPILPQIRELADHRIDVHAQIVLCPGLNDGDQLDRTLDELAQEHPASTGKRAGVQSVAIVPVGMTQFRERLPQLQHVERDYAREMIDRVGDHESRFESALGTRFAWLADEWYYIGDQPVPPKSHYEDFPQLEDGIGTLRLFIDNLKQLSMRLPHRAARPIAATLITAEMPARQVQELADRLNRVQDVQINVCVVQNRFFGGDIHIAGLLTARDILEQLADFAERHPAIYIPTICLRDAELFLDDVTLAEARQQSGLDLRVTGNSPRELAAALGLLPPLRTQRGGSRWVMEESLVSTNGV
jgi:putative radical SAM enzyme (TIGR03279 family)